MNKILAMLVAGTLLAMVFNGCKRQQPAPEPESAAPSAPPAKGNPEAEKAALQAARAWLELVDSSQYAKSWEEAAEYFKKAVPRETWQKSTEAFRKPLGTLVSRTVKSTQYTTSAPGAPDGEYVIIQYDSSFENKQSAVETVTPMLDSDNKWRVSGYYIK